MMDEGKVRKHDERGYDLVWRNGFKVSQTTRQRRNASCHCILHTVMEVSIFPVYRICCVPFTSVLRMQALAPSNSSTAAAVTFITFVQDLKRKTKAWGPMIELCANGEKTLERFRYQFPDDWLYSDQLRGEWSAYNEILKRKSDSIQEQLGALLLSIGLLIAKYSV
jgi:hypothetical protein